MLMQRSYSTWPETLIDQLTFRCYGNWKSKAIPGRHCKTQNRCICTFIMCFFRTASLQNLSLCVMILILQLTYYVRNIRCKISDQFFTVFSIGFYPRDAMLARVIEIATCLSVRLSVCPSVCPSVCLSVRPSRAGIVSKRRKLAA